MLSNVLRRASRALPATRLLHVSAVAPQPSGRDPRLSQGTSSQPKNYHSGDPHDQSARRGQEVGHGQPSTGYDAASRVQDQKTDRSGLTGNQEGVGFADQVGSASATGNKSDPRPSTGEGKGGQEESTPPGFVASIKSKLGFGTSSDEVKQNRGGGVGVTGTGALPFEKKPEEGRRPYHTSVVRAADKTRGQAPEASRQPKDQTYGDQNAHIKHKGSMQSPDPGKGNAADDPKLPSHQLEKKSVSRQDHQKRAFSSSARALETKHTAQSYFKDIDNSPARSQKTYQVDGSGTGPDIQRPDEPLTGPYSQAGANTKEYETVAKDDKYDVPPSSGPEKDQKLRYGNIPENASGQTNRTEVSKSGEGPEGSSKGGRKPEGRT
ncbi:hypothetical protein C8Q74DRAFT_1390841 [Fomes fomentarius]|nr:hypothetical protein C8Q74DRAFT_1390841 [Fomes fomentarius]